MLPGADLAVAAREILAGKAINAGQTCVAPDTVLLVGHARAAFAAACRASGIGLPETALATPAQAARLDALTDGATLLPLAADRSPRHRALQLAEAPAGHPLHQAELFGPILPVVELPDRAAAIAWVAARPPALALYLFGASARDESRRRRRHPLRRHHHRPLRRTGRHARPGLRRTRRIGLRPLPGRGRLPGFLPPAGADVAFPLGLVAYFRRTSRKSC